MRLFFLSIPAELKSAIVTGTKVISATSLVISIELKKHIFININVRNLADPHFDVRKDDILICSEISRLGRNLLQIMTILNICMKKEVQVWTIKDNYRLGKDIQSKVLAFAFSLSAEIERNLISQRTKEALARLKANGKKLGRVYGSKNKKHILDGKEQSVLKLIHKGVPKTQVAKIHGVSIYTIYEFLKNKDL